MILTFKVNPLKKERESNREFPEVFLYVNNYLYKKNLNSDSSQNDYDQN